MATHRSSSRVPSKKVVRGSGHSPRDHLDPGTLSVIKLLHQTFHELQLPQESGSHVPKRAVTPAALPAAPTAVTTTTTAPSPLSPRPGSPSQAPTPPLPTTTTSVDVMTLTRCIIVSYPEMTSGKLVMETINGELLISGKSPVGALRFLREWVALRYTDDFRRNRSLRGRLFAIVAMRPTVSVPGVIEELNALKLLLISMCAKRREVREGGGGGDGGGVRDRRSKALPKTISRDGKRSASVAGPVPAISGGGGSGTELSVLVLPTRTTTTTNTMNVNGFMKLDSRLIAVHMARSSFEALASLKLSDIALSVKQPDDPRSWPTVSEYTKRWNRIANWVASFVLIQKSVKAMRMVITKFLGVANFVYELGDYSSCFAIMAAFELQDVDRLRSLWKLPPNVKAMGARCYRVVNSKGNYHEYRPSVSSRIEAGKLCVIHLGVHQRDMTLSKNGNPVFDAQGNVNLQRLVVDGQVLALVARCQAKNLDEYPELNVKRDEALTTLLRELPGKSNAELERLSEVHKPRNNADLATLESRLDDSNNSNWSTQDLASQTSSGKSEESSSHSEDFADL